MSSRNGKATTRIHFLHLYSEICVFGFRSSSLFFNFLIINQGYRGVSTCISSDRIDIGKLYHDVFRSKMAELFSCGCS